MKHLVHKELRLAVIPLTWCFLLAGFLVLVPGYPILISAFFICLGIFYSFQQGRETNDVLYTLLLPVRKRDVAAARFLTVCIVQGCGFLLITLLTILRMTVLSQAEVYRSNPLMNPSPVFLALTLLIFAAFNVCFLGGFFKTAYQIGKPFLAFSAVTLLLVFAGEALQHLPGLGFLQTPQGERLGLQCLCLAAGAVLYAAATVLACRRAMKRMEQIDF
ncbi:MAG: ABC-2 transporter permease [Clostridia bacterium]|nr:ABC-2 transporter permease [Clostridia bacterium]